MSGVITSCQTRRCSRRAPSRPRARIRSVNAAWPHSSLAIFSVAVSVMPGSQTLTPQVSRTTWAPSLPHRVRSWASPCATGMSWMPLPPESASQAGSGTGQVWTISSRAISSGGSSRPPGMACPAWAAA